MYSAGMQQPPGPPSPQQFPPFPPAEKPKSGIPTWVIVLIAVIGAVVVLGGALATIAISGVNRYLASAKSVEAKVTVGAISRAAAAAYERESVGSALLDVPEGEHRLCASATPVPATLDKVRGAKYVPSSAPGLDFATGSAIAGWTCLRFTMETPMYYRYQYNQGSGYLVPSLSPGADGFEASAQGDLNGDGVLSTFAIAGKVGPSGAVVVSPSVYIENEFE